MKRDISCCLVKLLSEADKSALECKRLSKVLLLPRIKVAM